MNSHVSTFESVYLTDGISAFDAESFAEALRRIRTPPVSQGESETRYKTLSQSGARRTSDYRFGAGANT